MEKNEVIKRSSDIIDRSSFKLLTLPDAYGINDGLLILAKDTIIYRNILNPNIEFKLNVPKKPNVFSTQHTGAKDDGVYFISHVFHHDPNFLLIQTEFGDLFKITFNISNEEATMNVKYFDTTAPATFLAILDTKYLYTASENGNHYLYSIQTYADDDEDLTYVSNIDGKEIVYFNQRSLKNLSMEDEIEILSPIIDVKTEDLFKDDSTQLICLCGSGPRSTLRLLRHGLPVTEVVKFPLQTNPDNVWTIKHRPDDNYEKFILLSYPESTTILQIDESVNQLSENDPNFNLFVSNASTLHAGNFGDGFVQIHTEGIQYVRDDQVTSWQPEEGKQIVQASSNHKQIVIALNGGEIHYFEADKHNNNLNHVSEISLSSKEILAIALPQSNDEKSNFVAIADNDSKLRLYNLTRSDTLQITTVQQLPSKASSVAFISLNSAGTLQQYVVVGTINGIMIRNRIDEDGQLSDTRTKFLGTKGIKISQIRAFNNDALLLISTRPWMLYSYQNIVRVNPLGTSLDIAATFSSESLCNEGIIGCHNQTLKVYTFNNIEDMFSQTEMPLRYTPRQSTIVPTTKYMIITEADHNAYPYKDLPTTGTTTKKDDAMDIEDEGIVSFPPSLYNVPKPGPNCWGSCIRLVDVRNMKTLCLIELENNECALSVTTVTFRDYSNEIFVCIGVAKDLVLYPKRQCSKGYIYVYKFQDNGKKLEMVERTEVNGIPTALAPYHGRLLAGIGNTLVLYDLGKIKCDLVKKCENSSFPSSIVSISTYGERIIIGDIQESFHFAKYNRPNNSIHIVVDDTVPRWITSSEALDYNTVAGSDKFGNIFILRVPDNIAHLDHEPLENRNNGYRTGSYKLDNLCNFYTGETVTKLKKVLLMQGCSEFLLYTTIHGMIGALVPLTTKEEVNFFSTLELFLRKENPPLCGRDHLSYRSSFFTLKNVIDGDLCEQFSILNQEKQSIIVEEIDRSVLDIQRKIERIRENI